LSRNRKSTLENGCSLSGLLNLLRLELPWIKENTKNVELLLLWLQRFSFCILDMKDKDLFISQYQGYFFASYRDFLALC